MQEQGFEIGRREFFAAAGAGAIAALAFASEAGAAAQSAGEQANRKLVEGFCKGWMAKAYDADKEMPRFLADDSSVRMEEDKPPLIGAAAVAAAWKGFATSGQSIDVKILEVFAKGPVVVTSRIDTVKAPGKADQIYKVAGVFIVKGGKIKEWTDFLVS